MAEVGKDCHIKLTHAQVAGGVPVGFLLENGPGNSPGPVFSIQRVVDHAGQVSIRVFFDVLAADDLLNPDGSPHAVDRGDIYQAITDFLTCLEGIAVETPVGIFSNVGAEGHSATEFHYGRLSVISCQLNNVGPYFPPRGSGSVLCLTVGWNHAMVGSLLALVQRRINELSKIKHGCLWPAYGSRALQ